MLIMPIVFKSCAMLCLALLFTYFEHHIAFSENEINLDISTVSVGNNHYTIMNRRTPKYQTQYTSISGTLKPEVVNLTLVDMTFTHEDTAVTPTDLNFETDEIQDENKVLNSTIEHLYNSSAGIEPIHQEKPTTYEDGIDSPELIPISTEDADNTQGNSYENLEQQPPDQDGNDGIVGYWTYSWNKTHVSPVDYQQSYCPRRCLDGNILLVNNVYDKCPRDKCYNCQCQRPACEVYGICCPDVSEPNFKLPGVSNSYLQPAGNRADSWRRISENPIKKLGCDVDKSDRTFLYIRSCPSNYSDGDEVVRQCVDEFVHDNVTVNTFTRVMDINTNAVYWNVFCAECNGAVNVKPFLVRIQCKNYMAVYKATNPDQFLRLSLKDESTCSTSQEFQNGMNPLSCDRESDNARVVDTCPTESSDMQDYEDIVNACHNLNGHIYQIRNDFGFFKNIFCSICHRHGYPTYSNVMCAGTGWSQTDQNMPAFSMLLNFGKGSYHRGRAPQLSTNLFQFANCSETEWAHPDGQCVLFECSPGKLLLNETCHTVFPDVRGLGYVLRLWLLPQTNKLDTSKSQHMNISIYSALENVFKKLNDHIFYMTEENSVELGIVVDKILNLETYEINHPYFIWLEARLIASRLFGRDDFEKKILETINTDFLEVQLTPEVNVTFESLILPDMFSGRINCDDTLNFKNGQNCAVIHQKFMGFDRKDMEPFYESYLNVANILNCSYVTFSNLSYQMIVYRHDVIPTLSLTLNLNVTTLFFKDTSELNLLAIEGDGSLHVCHELLNKKLLELEYQFKLMSGSDVGRNLNIRAQYILTLICLVASMISLLLTLVTYFRFPVLRTLAGRNNIFLCISLLLAQSSLLASSHLSGPSPLCTFVGISTHFFWLWMFTWTFICSYRMFSVFTAKTRGSFTSSTKEGVAIARDFLISIPPPSAVVVTVVVTSYVTSDGEEMGYGDWTCYLNTELLIGTSMIGPLTVVTTCNLLFFLITVLKISNVRKLMTKDSNKSEDRQNLFVYIKLSTLTGAFWIIGVLGQAFDTDILRYTSILLNGLQGVFLFMSYICNKRVLNLYIKQVVVKEQSTNSSNNPYYKNTASDGMSKNKDKSSRGVMTKGRERTSSYSISQTEY